MNSLKINEIWHKDSNFTMDYQSFVKTFVPDEKVQFFWCGWLFEVLENLMDFDFSEIRDLSKKLFDFWCFRVRELYGTLFPSQTLCKHCVNVVNCSIDVFWTFCDLEMIITCDKAVRWILTLIFQVISITQKLLVQNFWISENQSHQNVS
jgi:hypothetical protein